MRKKALAIPIRCSDYSNTSQVVSLFTREFGVVQVIAKGAFRERNAFQGPFDLAVLYQAVYLERQGLAIVTEAEVLEGWRGLRRDWHRHLGAAHAIELLRLVGVPGDPAVELFDLAVETFVALAIARRRTVQRLVARFNLRALRILGLLPPIVACVECGRRWPAGDTPVFLSPRAGGLLCRMCRNRRPQVHGSVLAGRAARVLREWTAEEEAVDAQVVEPEWERYGAALTNVVFEMRAALLEREPTVLQSTPL